MTTNAREPSSFRDPNGFLFRDAQGTLLRQVHASYEAHYKQLMESGLYPSLLERKWIVEHEQYDLSHALDERATRILRPMELPFISYPYEWCFSALKNAALLTLDIQQAALQHGMSLKDASAYNVQFDGTRPLLIDTLSFETYRRGKPWIAYGQFCRHFLAPLTLMAKRDIRLGRLLSAYVDGIPLDLASRLLPGATLFSPSSLFHVHLHAKMLSRHADTSNSETAAKVKQANVSRAGLDAIIDSLRRAVAKLRWLKKSEWSDYYDDNSYTDAAFEVKQKLVREHLVHVKPRTVWDLGANTGEFSRIAADVGAHAVAFDIDPACVEINFRKTDEAGALNLLPLVFDLSNPSPAIGWANQERRLLAERGPADLVMALALVHHLAIANNVPFDRIAGYFRELGRHLVVEFVPKEDVQSQRLLQSREDIFDDYHQRRFEQSFAVYFRTVDKRSIADGGRWLYLMEAI